MSSAMSYISVTQVTHEYLNDIQITKIAETVKKCIIYII